MAGTFALSQAVQLLEDALHLPGWLLTATVIVSLALFPVIAILAWIFDVGSEGVSRTPDQPATGFHWSPAHIGIATIVLAVLLVGGWVALKPRAETAPRVAVLPLENGTLDASLESLGEMAADWITDALVQAAIVDVVDLQTTLRAGITAPSEKSTIAADRLVTGKYYRTGDRLQFNIRITSSAGKLIETIQPIESSLSDPTAGLNDLRDRVLATLAKTVDKRVANFEGASSAPSYQAYESYVEGLKAYLTNDFTQSATLFRRAFELDSTFLRARVWEAGSLAWSGSREDAHRLFDELIARSNQLSPYDRHHVVFFKAVSLDDQETAYQEAQAMVKASPGSDDAARELALSELRTGRFRAAIKSFEELDQTSGISRDWPEYYFMLANAYTGDGDPDGALEVARRGRAADSSWGTLVTLGWAEAALNPARAVALADSVVKLFPNAAGAYRIGIALSAAGHREDAIRVWRQIAAQPVSPEARWFSLYFAGDYDEVSAAIDTIPVQRDPQARILAVRGMIAARRGNLAYARAVLDSIKQNPKAVHRLQARLFAALGERDSAVKYLDRKPFEGQYDALTRQDPDLQVLVGYPPFEQAIRPRR